jgi:hypothetical protein
MTAGAAFPAADQADSAPSAATAKDPAAAAETVQTECGACHMVYPPQFLPARSWRALLAGLANHFGEDASLEPATARQIAGYLMANAADTPNGEPAFLRGLLLSETPLRITDTPLWRDIHPRLLGPGVGSGPGIRSAANCLRCHNGSGEAEGE